MTEPVEPFEAYLRNALDACITARVAARGYNMTTDRYIQSAKDNLDAALATYPQWAAKYLPTPPMSGERG